MTRLTSPPAIPAAEFRERQVRVAEATRDQELDGLLIWSSCGSALDAFGNVFYLTNHYSPVPRVNVDIAPFMTGWGQTSLVLTAAGESTLVVEGADWRRDLVVADHVRHSRDVYGETARAIRDAGLDGASVGLVGASCLPLAAWSELTSTLDTSRFRPTDAVLFERRAIKSGAEIALMRHASAVGCEIQNAMLPLAVVGRTDNDLARRAYEVCCDYGAVPWDFAFASGPSSGHGYWSRLPPWDRHRRYEAGDIVHPDVYGCVDGYFFDLQRTVVVGGQPSDGQRWLLEGAVEVVHALCRAARPGALTADLARLRFDWLREYGYSDGPKELPPGADTDVIDELVACGHGLGLGFELPWIDSTSTAVLEPGMIIALEVYLSDPGIGTVVTEEVVLVTEGEPEILTTGCPSRWW